jgi:hypothetical protein
MLKGGSLMQCTREKIIVEALPLS